MENNELRGLINTIRNIAQKDGIDAISIEELSENPLIDKVILKKYVANDKQLAERILENERINFENFFLEENFENNNAIDNFIIVSEIMAKNFNYLTPSFYPLFQERYPDLYQSYFEIRAEFVFNKINGNLKRGISMGYYRDDLSVELLSRRYISRLFDLYNPDNFPPEKISFNDFFNQMIENFVLSIVTDKGLAYWNKKMLKTHLK